MGQIATQGTEAVPPGNWETQDPKKSASGNQRTFQSIMRQEATKVLSKL